MRQKHKPKDRQSWGDRPPETYASNYIHHNFVQFGKQHSWYKAILSSTVLSQQCCEVLYTSSLISSEAVTRPDYQILLKSPPTPPNLTGWIQSLVIVGVWWVKSMVPTVSHIREKIKLFCWIKTWHVKTMISTWRLVWHAINKMLAKQQEIFNEVVSAPIGSWNKPDMKEVRN